METFNESPEINPHNSPEELDPIETSEAEQPVDLTTLEVLPEISAHQALEQEQQLLSQVEKPTKWHLALVLALGLVSGGCVVRFEPGPSAGTIGHALKDTIKDTLHQMGDDARAQYGYPNGNRIVEGGSYQQSISVGASGDIHGIKIQGSQSESNSYGRIDSDLGKGKRNNR